MKRTTIVINDADLSLGRLDKLLATRLPDLSRSKIERMIKSGAITVNGRAEKPSYEARLGDVITIIETPEPTTLTAAAIPFGVIHEDDDIIVVDKPVGLVTHPAPGHHGDTLVNGLLARFPSLSGINGNERPGIVHRIDKDTSGLLVVAKNDDAHRYLAAQLADHTISRTYIALVKGTIQEETATIKAPIGRHARFRKKMDVNIATGKAAVTRFKVKARYLGYTLLEVELETGRTHQIRVHLAYIGHPIVGDLLYGGKDPLYHDGQLLHAFRLRLIHPKTKKAATYEAPLPAHFQTILTSLEQRRR